VQVHQGPTNIDATTIIEEGAMRVHAPVTISDEAVKVVTAPAPTPVATRQMIERDEQGRIAAVVQIREGKAPPATSGRDEGTPDE
jgi:hypothetical protein